MGTLPLVHWYNSYFHRGMFACVWTEEDQKWMTAGGRSGAGSRRPPWLVGSSLGAGMHGAVWAVVQWTQVGPCGVGDDCDGRAARGAERLTRGQAGL